MTYCIGWKSATSIFVLADSATTGCQSIWKSFPALHGVPSSVGEYSHTEKGLITEESIYKVYGILDKIIMGFAGNVTCALHFRELLRDTIVNTRDLRQAIDSAIKSSTPIKEGNEFQAIIGYFHEERPILLVFNPDGDQRIHEVNSNVHLGSATNVFQPVADAFTWGFKTYNIYDERQLAFLTSALQHFTAHEYLPFVKAGGIFYGARLTKSGLEYLKDITYFFYITNANEIIVKDKVSIFYRQNTMVISSTMSKATKFITMENHGLTRKQKEEKYDSLGDKLEPEYRSEYYAFISLKDRLVTLVKSNGNYNNKYMSINKNTITMHPPLKAKLFPMQEIQRRGRLQFSWLIA